MMLDTHVLSVWVNPGVFAVPLIAAVVTFLIGANKTSRAIGLLVPVAVFAASVLLVIATMEGEVVVSQVAGWQGGVAIAFVADLLSALMLGVSAVSSNP
jgi:hypothetical protein